MKIHVQNKHKHNRMDIYQLICKAEQGDLQSQKELAKTLHLGLHHKKYVFWTQKAAEQGDLDSLLDLVITYSLGPEKDLTKAEEILRRVEKEISSDDFCKLQQAWKTYYSSIGNMDKYKSILFNYSKESMGCKNCSKTNRYDLWGKTCPSFLEELARYYKNKTEYKNEYNKIISFFKSLAEQGDCFACSYMYYNLDTEQRERLKWLKKAADQGDAECQLNYATELSLGKEDPQMALEYFEKAAYGENLQAISMLAVIYENGWLINGEEIVKKNNSTAFKWYLKGAEGGDEECMLKCALFYENGSAGLVNYTKAIVWYLRAVKIFDSTNAMILLGEKYEDGVLIKRDNARAMYWFKKAADNGDTKGMRILAEKYEKGILTKKDYAKAFAWYTKAFNESRISHEDLALKLAFMYEKGLGTKKDTDKALEYYRYAASRKVKGATKALADFKKRTPLKNEFKVYEKKSYYDNPPSKSEMLFTHGRLRPCPRCGSDKVETFSDGTAICHTCKKWYAYA